MRLLLILIGPVLMLGCSQQKPDPAHPAELVGTWANNSLTVNMNTVNNSDTDSLLQIDDPSQWVQILRMRPILTLYNVDGTYYSVYRNLTDSIVHQPSGIWKVIGDSLLLNQKYPYDYLSTFHFSVDGPKVEFVGILDWDQDGQNDDLYSGIQTRVEDFLAPPADSVFSITE